MSVSIAMKRPPVKEARMIASLLRLEATDGAPCRPPRRTTRGDSECIQNIMQTYQEEDKKEQEPRKTRRPGGLGSF